MESGEASLVAVKVDILRMECHFLEADAAAAEVYFGQNILHLQHHSGDLPHLLRLLPFRSHC
jgi:hypothetical protein